MEAIGIGLVPKSPIFGMGVASVLGKFIMHEGFFQFLCGEVRNELNPLDWDCGVTHRENCRKFR